MAVKPFRTKVVMGKQNIRSSDSSSAAHLSRAFQASMAGVLGNLDRFISHMEGVSADIVADALEPTFGKAIDYCPKDTHDLVNSAYLEARPFRGGARAEMGFGRGGVPNYAVYVHEMTAYNHEWPTRAKFLEAAVDEDTDDILGRVAAITRGYAGT